MDNKFFDENVQNLLLKNIVKLLKENPNNSFTFEIKDNNFIGYDNMKEIFRFSINKEQQEYIMKHIK